MSPWIVWPLFAVGAGLGVWSLLPRSLDSRGATPGGLPFAISVLVVLAVAILGFLSRADGIADVRPTQSFADVDGDGRIDCRGTSDNCLDPGVMDGVSINRKDHESTDRPWWFGVDTDGDGQAERLCSETATSVLATTITTPSGPSTHIDWDGVVRNIDCEDVDASGPGADRFLLADGQTPVDRIDFSEDGEPDFIVIGDHEPIAIDKRPWWERASTLLAAVVGGLATLLLQFLGRRASAKEEEA